MDEIGRQEKASADLRQPVTLPGTVTLQWLRHYVPMSFWFWAGGLLFSTLGIGILIGQTTLVKELVGKGNASATPAAVAVTSDDLKQRVDQLVDGHNKSIQILYEGIALEERMAGSSPSYESGHREAADRLRVTLDKENETFKSNLANLKLLGERGR